MAKLGAATVFISADLASLNKALGEAERAVKRSMGNILDAAQSIGVGMAAIGAGILAGLGVAAAAASESEDALAQLDAVIKSTGDAAAAAGDGFAKMSDEAATALADMQQDFAEKLDDITSQSVQATQDVREALARETEDFQRDQQERQQQYGEALGNLQQELQQSLEDLAQQHADRMASIQQEMEDLALGFGEGQEDRAQRRTDNLESIEEQAGNRRAGLAKKLAEAKTDAERAALKQQMADVDAEEAKDKAKVEQRYAKEEARARRHYDLKMARLRASLEEEAVEYEKHNERLKGDEAKREAELSEGFARETADAKRNYDRQVADAQEKLQKINAEREKDLARLQEQQDKEIQKYDEKYTAIEKGQVAVRAQAQMTREELIALSKALEKTSTFDDEAILGAEALLKTFTNVGKVVFPDATQAILDMSTAMGTDLKTTTVQVGKALQDPVAGVTALQRAGVKLSEQQKQQIKDFMAVGDAASAQKVILGELNKEFGGSAAAAANTFSGKMKQLKNALGDLLEVIGKPIIDSLRGLAASIKPIIAEMEAWATSHPELIKTLVLIAGVIGTVAAVVGGLLMALGPMVLGWSGLTAIFASIGPILAAVGAAFLAMLSPMGLVVAGVAALIAAWVKHVGGIGAAWEIVKQKAAALWNGLKVIWDAMVPYLVSGWEHVKSAFMATGTWLLGVVTMIKNTIAQWIAENAPALHEFGKNVWNAVGPVWAQIKQSFMDAWGGIVAFWNTTGPQLMVVIQGVLKFILAGVLWFVDGWNKHWQGIRTTWMTTWNVIAAVVKTAWDILSPLLGQVTAVVGGFAIALSPLLAGAMVIRSAFNLLWGALSGFSGILSPFMGALGVLRTAFMGTVGLLNTMAGGALGLLRTGLSGAMSGLQTLFTGTLTVLRTGFAASLTGMRAAFLATLTLLRTAFAGTVALLRGMLAVIGGPIALLYAGLAALITGGFYALYQTLQGWANGTGFDNWITRLIDTQVPALGKAIDWVMNKIVGFMGSISDAIKKFSEFIGLTSKAPGISDYTQKGIDSGKYKKYASGTDWHPGGLALVGERGRELMDLPAGTRVYNNHETERILNGSGGGGGRVQTFNNSIAVHAANADGNFARKLVELLAGEQRRLGKVAG